jgi:prepilin-type N-terminal cleavage/methylation domain-containing protein
MRTYSARTSNRGGTTIESAGVRRKGFTLVELLVVVSMLALLVLVAQLNLFGALQRSTFKSQVQSFVSTMQMAASGAAETGRRYEVIVDVSEQTYLLREITSSDLSEILDEEIIVEGLLGDSCRVSYVEFDDGEFTNGGQAKFRIGHAGWMYGGKVVLLDEQEQSHAILINRLNPVVQLVDGDPELMRPKSKDEVPSF